MAFNYHNKLNNNNLSEIFKFTQEDLFENKQGRFSKNQKKKFSSEVGKMVRFYLLFFLAILLFYIGVFYFTATDFNVFKQVIFKALPGILFLVIFGLSSSGVYRSFGFQEEKILSTIGQKKVKKQNFAKTGKAFYYFSIGEWVHTTYSPEEFNAFEEGKTYKVYYLNTRYQVPYLLSIEEL